MTKRARKAKASMRRARPEINRGDLESAAIRIDCIAGLCHELADNMRREDGNDGHGRAYRALAFALESEQAKLYAILLGSGGET